MRHEVSMRRLSLVTLLLATGSAAATAGPSPDEVRLYVLDCGRAVLDDGAAASDTGEYDGRRLELADPCFLVRHPKGWLLWDAGLAPDVASGPGFHPQPGPPLAGQLRALGLAPSDVSFVAFSHLHFDHVGNAKLFAASTFILERDELAWAEHAPPHVSMVPELFSVYRSAKTLLIDGDHDVFGDGAVAILAAPGHTPGSAVLRVKLRGGAVLLSGDLYITRESRRSGLVPTVNADRAATLASMARIERIAAGSGARVVIQHDVEDYLSLPRPPAYLR